MKIDSLCVQGAYEPKNGEPRVIPIVQSTTFKYESSVEMGELFDLKKSGYFYSRLQNPTCDYVAAKIAKLEGGVSGMLTGSGQAASFYSVFNIAGAGDHIVSSSAIYGGTFNLFNVTMRKLGIDFTFISRTLRKKKFVLRFSRTPKRFSVRPSLTPVWMCSILKHLPPWHTKTAFHLLLIIPLPPRLCAARLNTVPTL